MSAAGITTVFHRPDGYAIGYFERTARSRRHASGWMHALSTKWQAKMSRYTSSGQVPLVGAAELSHYFYLGDRLKTPRRRRRGTSSAATFRPLGCHGSRFRCGRRLCLPCLLALTSSVPCIASCSRSALSVPPRLASACGRRGTFWPAAKPSRSSFGDHLQRTSPEHALVSISSPRRPPSPSSAPRRATMHGICGLF